MKLLLDTHAWLWWLLDDPGLPAVAKQAIQEPDSEVFISAVTAMELATKYRLGKLSKAGPMMSGYEQQVSADGFSHLPVSYHHTLRAGAYTVEHRDPFDRILAAQAELDGLTLVTRDPAFASFKVKTLW
jgi:PIN domain nuclease of toxin-antitoxin system